jgi:2-oxoglutarate dehydrogenase E1 component
MSANLNSLFQINSGYAQQMYDLYKQDPNAVDRQWRAYFEGYKEELEEIDATFEFKVVQFVQAWKSFGHLHAKTNPLGIEPKKNPILFKETYGLLNEDLGRQTRAGFLAGFDSMPLADLIQQLENRFAGSVGAEIDHIQDLEERDWLYSEFAKINQPISKENQLAIYTELAKADALEKTIATKYIGKKRFSIEGADAQIPACESFLEESANLGVEECTVAIAHRGRLNFLVHVVGKPLEKLLAEWEGYPHENMWGDGDVKYHNGYESVRNTRGGKQMNVAMCFNPSHLEYVSSTVMGNTRARQAAYHNSDKSKVACIVFHGDAALAGQGIVYENAQMVTLEGYSIGGTVHVVANNQVGFTTNPADARSSTYCTDVAKVTNSPVFHVNAQNLDQLDRVMKICAGYRNKFKKDIYVDLICYRRYGHNEGDEPTFTQPVLYKLIKEKSHPYEEYMNYLTLNHGFDSTQLQNIYAQLRADMNATYDKVKSEKLKIEQFVPLRDAGKLTLVGEAEILKPTDTKFSIEKLKEIGQKICSVPSDFHVNPKLARIIVSERNEMAQGNKPVDWGMAELLAYGSLISEGYSIRLTGEDVQRGTFAHRQVVLTDSENNSRYNLLSGINEKAKVEVINSFLSEEATMGYEYGYAALQTNALTLWEGQFGDFANGAQVIIDQFISSGESKWRQSQGLVLLLPHGMEGMGAEHSSARLERFLQLCAQGNMQVCYFTNASQLFHAFRRQMLRPFRKPMIVMTPKSFLRSQRAATSLENLANGSFEEILDDSRIAKNNLVERVLVCSGKIALDLFDALETEKYKSLSEKVAVIRLEQIYPFHSDKMNSILSKYKNAKTFAWVQEEPSNMGAWQFVRPKLESVLEKCGLSKLVYLGRSARVAPAVGLEKLHHIEQETLIEAALTSSLTKEV